MLKPTHDREPRWSRWLGPWLVKVRLHTIEARFSPVGPPTIAKRRRWFAPPLIVPGNLFLRIMISGVSVLPVEEWHDRELSVHRALYGIDFEIDPLGWLILPRWPGVALSEYARNPLVPSSDRLLALIAATRALRALHQVELMNDDGRREPLSHGDATLRNVLFDPATAETRWIDFDTAHDPSRPPNWRRADDLRALLASAVESFADLTVATLFRTVHDAYPDAEAWRELRDRMARGSLHRSPFHLAQAYVPDARRREMETLPYRDVESLIP